MLHGVMFPDRYREWTFELNRSVASRRYEIASTAVSTTGQRFHLEVTIDEFAIETLYSEQERTRYLEDLRDHLISRTDEETRRLLYENPDLVLQTAESRRARAVTVRLDQPLDTERLSRAAAQVGVAASVSADTFRRIGDLLDREAVQRVQRMRDALLADSPLLSETMFQGRFRHDLAEPAFVGVDLAKDDKTPPPVSKRKKTLVSGKLADAENPATLKVATKVRKLRVRKE